MAQASQQLPSWLTLSSTVITEPDGSVQTSFTTLQLPLTYYGPSIPLGTDGVWTYGGLTPPPTNTPTSTTPATPTSNPILTIPPPSSSPSSSLPTSSSFLFSSPSSPQPSISSSVELSSLSHPSSSTAVPPSSSSAVPAAVPSHGISTAVLGAVLGSILGLLLLLVLILTLCLLRRNTIRRRRSNPEAGNTNTSSFWNRQTSLFTIPWRRGDNGAGDRRSTPIWTGWEFMGPEGIEENGRSANSSRGRGDSAALLDGSRTPGDGSPRGSGEEADPFLTRRSIRSAKFDDEKGHTKSVSDTLVSVPVAAAKVGGGSIRSSPPKSGHIIPRDAQRRIAEEEDAKSPYTIRVVEATPHQDYSPLLPPPPLNPDGLVGLAAGPSSRRHSDKSLDSHRTHGQSLHSEKSTGSFDVDPAEFLIARRVRVGDLARSHSRLPTIESEANAGSSSQSGLGLSGLTGRLGRLSWFRRLSGSITGAGNNQDFTVDPYTRTPPRSSRNGSNSRPGSWARVPEAEADNSINRRSRHDSGLGLGFLNAADRPISGISQTTTSGNTVYFDANSRPATPGIPAVPSLPRILFPIPVTAAEDQARLSRLPADNRVTLSDSYQDPPSNPPPTYDDASLPRVRNGVSPVDVLDLSAPAPTSAFAAGRPVLPPGLRALPLPSTWRDSYATDNLSPVGSRDSAGRDIDIEDEPPVAQESWRDLATARDGRRRTFGLPAMVQSLSAMSSQHPSVHSLRSHLRPEGDRSGSQSDPSTDRSHGGSHSSRPSGHSQMISVRSDPSFSEEGRPDEIGELRSPPLSAVLGSFGSSRPPSSQAPLAAGRPSDTYITPASSRAPLLGGTITSSTTTDTNTNSSATTALTDPITGGTMYLPSLSWVRGQDPVQRPDSWHDTYGEEDSGPW
ncbi:hypothetical protein BC835DRAFT_1419328 [Cytidiella melzeri]|nr:hypothetical protein BC835DRAFT_1419328 [Cytidiella melzeri]